MQYSAKDHTFVVCAYGESRYIEECLCSVLDQRLRTNVIAATSTPSEYLENVCSRHKVPLFINHDRVGTGNIARDWNYAISCAQTPIVTIAHQDDIYKRNYTYEVINSLNMARRPLIAFTDYSELRNGIEVSNIKNLRIKRLMLFPLRWKTLWKSVFVRRRILSAGSAICCPSVAYVMDNLPKPLFIQGFKSNLDWEAWERFSKLQGEFVFINQELMSHRIHEESETSAGIRENIRSCEDYEMLCRFWPEPIARVIEHFYKKGEIQNRL